MLKKWRRKKHPITNPAMPIKPSSSVIKAIIRERKHQLKQEEDLQEHASHVLTLPIAPQDLIDWVGGGDETVFHQVGLMSAHQLMLYCRLKPTDKILEPGCGCGRNARSIGPYLDPKKGIYEGFDIYQKAITWANENITSYYPNVHFTFADIENTNYNPQGTINSSEYLFPYESQYFDIVFLPSVFTHMTSESFQHYINEIKRVLKPGGLLLSWHFLLNDTSKGLIQARKSALTFSEFDTVSWVQQKDNPCAAIAFDESYVLNSLESVGLRGQSVIYGSWSGRDPEGYIDFQDRILAMNTDPTLY